MSYGRSDRLNTWASGEVGARRVAYAQPRVAHAGASCGGASCGRGAVEQVAMDGVRRQRAVTVAVGMRQRRAAIQRSALCPHGRVRHTDVHQAHHVAHVDGAQPWHRGHQPPRRPSTPASPFPSRQTRHVVVAVLGREESRHLGDGVAIQPLHPRAGVRHGDDARRDVGQIQVIVALLVPVALAAHRGAYELHGRRTCPPGARTHGCRGAKMRRSRANSVRPP
jgi:hypothetical protein